MGRTYFLGFITGMSLATLLYLLNGIIENNPTTQATQQGRFEVVDEYKGCDIVRWTDSNFANYKFFLYCRGSK